MRFANKNCRPTHAAAATLATMAASAFVAFGDGQRAPDSADGRNPKRGYWMFVRHWYGGGVAGIGFNHDSMANTLMGDGHVETQSGHAMSHGMMHITHMIGFHGQLLYIP